MTLEGIFTDRASNGTPRDKLDNLKDTAPDLYAKIINARSLGEVYEDDFFRYNIVPNDKYGDTVYKNSKSRRWSKGQSKAQSGDTTTPTPKIGNLEDVWKTLNEILEELQSQRTVLQRLSEGKHAFLDRGSDIQTNMDGETAVAGGTGNED